MIRKTIESMRRRVGPVGLSLAAAALTAVAFAAVSVAKDDGSNGDQARAGGDEATFEHRVGPPRMEDLSEEDRQALEEFKQCMEDNGAPAPPEPGDFEDGERPEPPSEADREKIEKALDACRDKLPEGVHHFGPGGPCGPPPPGARGEGAAIPAPPPGPGNES
jgi:hypothetical protein